MNVGIVIIMALQLCVFFKFFLLSIFEVKMFDFFTSMMVFSKFYLVDTSLGIVF